MILSVYNSDVKFVCLFVSATELVYSVIFSNWHQHNFVPFDPLTTLFDQPLRHPIDFHAKPSYSKFLPLSEGPEKSLTPQMSQGWCFFTAHALLSKDAEEHNGCWKFTHTEEKPLCKRRGGGKDFEKGMEWDSLLFKEEKKMIW